MWQATLEGRIISKKNSKQVFRAHGRTIVSTSKAYKSWHEAAHWQLVTKRPKTPLTGPLHLSCVFFLKGKLDSDLDNMMSSIADLLQDVGVIENDKQILKATLEKRPGHPDFVTQISLTEL